MTDRNDITSKRQEIVAKLTQARLEKGLSQAQLAEMVGTQRSNICRSIPIRRKMSIPGPKIRYLVMIRR